MKPPARLWLWLGGGLLALVVVSAALQAINNLIWQLSYLLPAWHQTVFFSGFCTRWRSARPSVVSTPGGA